MSTYTVRPGDTLGRIAASQLGAAKKWRLLADFNNLDNPNRLRVGHVLEIPEPTPVSNVVNVDRQPQAAARTMDAPTPPLARVREQPTQTEVRISTRGNTVFAVDADGEWHRIGTRKNAGLYRIGNQEPERFIADNAAMLSDLNLTRSEIAVMAATSENEGNFDAVNTWDGHFLSFGIFQWTSGPKDGPGELPALLQKIKTSFPDDFQHYWGRYGLDVADVRGTTGWLTLDGRRLSSKAEKQQLRDSRWAYRFATAGADLEVKAAQITHGVSRIRSFYFSRRDALNRVPLAELITSEFGVALLLDNHVNRPGYVFKCVGEAIIECGMTPAELVSGDAADERRVVDAYLGIRERYGRRPMTDARHRGEVTRAYLTRGEISDARGSFQIGH
ncbi:MAG: LysM domain-containing protein [Gammaproteobacteria bacterium]|nr:LysM domain-containing protein [Gammaproteobacteria bacterium]